MTNQPEASRTGSIRPSGNTLRDKKSACKTVKSSNLFNINNLLWKSSGITAPVKMYGFEGIL
jgi:hypothetical protein